MCLCFSDVFGFCSQLLFIVTLGSVLVIFVFVHVLLMCYPLQTSLSVMSSYHTFLYISWSFHFLDVSALVHILIKYF